MPNCSRPNAVIQGQKGEYVRADVTKNVRVELERATFILQTINREVPSRFDDEFSIAALPSYLRNREPASTATPAPTGKHQSVHQIVATFGSSLVVCLNCLSYLWCHLSLLNNPGP